MFSLLIGSAVMAGAQSRDAVEVASSADGAASSAAMPFASSAAMPVAPEPVAAAGGQYEGGGYGSSGHSWSNRIAFEAGGGANAPLGNDKPFITYGGNFTVGGGLHLQRHISVLAEYQFIDDKLPGSLISDAGSQGGHAHIWSLTVDPVIDLFPKRRNDVYVTGGGGFYRKVTSFTDPEEVEQCYYFCTVGVEDVVVSHFSSNQGGVNFGVGVTHKVGDAMKVYAEARYLWIDTPEIGTPDGLGHTELLPVTIGVRF